ncbi:hypothetical protein ACLKA7_007813 [Drosophila subpalustris]
MNVQLNEFDTVMEQIGFGKVHCYVMLTLGLLQMLTIHETMGMGIIAPSAVCDLRMSLVQLSSITAAAFLGLVAFFLLLQMPESPKFLFMIGDTKQGLAVMDWISLKNTGRPLSSEQVLLMQRFQESTGMRRQKRANNLLQTMLNDAMPLFRKPYVGFYVGSCSVMFSLGLVANGLGIWFTAMRNRSNMRQDNKTELTLCRILFKTTTNDILDSEPDLLVACNDGFIGFNDSLILGLTYIILYNICWFMLFFLPRKAMFIAALVISSSCGFALIFVTGRWLQLFSFVLFIALPGVVISLLGGALLEFVPTFLRAKALCISLMWCRWGAVVGTTIVGIYVEKSCEMTILVIAIFPMLSASIEGFLPL